MEWYDLGRHLGVPSLIRMEAEDKYSDDTQRKKAMLEEWRNHHPAPSWMLVANVLYSSRIGRDCWKYHKLLQVVKEKYLKGEIFLHMSHCVVEVCHTCTEHRLRVEDIYMDFRFENILPPSIYPSSGVDGTVHC